MNHSVILENKSLDDLIDIIYPVGSVYISVTSTNPKVLFGGEWTQIKDTFLLACGNSYANGATGGEANHTLTISEMPSHEHAFWYNWGGSGNVGGNWKISMIATPNGGGGTWPNTSGLNNVALNGGSQPHNNMPPYLAVYM